VRLASLFAGLPVLGLAGKAFGSAGSAQTAHVASLERISKTDESVHHEVLFKASRKRVYEALTETKQFNQVVMLSGAMQGGMPPGAAPTEISRELGGAFSIFGGHIVGRQVELVPDERIVQAWRVVDWNPGVYSIVKFELVDQGAETKLILDHAGFPGAMGQHLSDGWRENYWEPLGKYLA
jgi:activator of HSP90 ATPase